MISGPSPDVSVLCAVITALLSALAYFYKTWHNDVKESEAWYRELVEKTLKDNFRGIVDALDVQGDNMTGLVTVNAGIQQILSEVGKYVQEERWKDQHAQSPGAKP